MNGRLGWIDDIKRTAPTISWLGSLGALAASLCLPVPAMAQDSDGFTWSVTPYLWASRTEVDLSYRGDSIGGDEISFDDLLGVLDSAFMIHAEGGRGYWSGYLDLTYLETSDREERTLFTIDTDSEQVILDAAVAWWPGGAGSALSLIGGLRYTGFDDRYHFILQSTEVATRRNTADYYDALLGIRYRFDLSERWALATHADASFGDSEGTWVLRAMFAYTVGKRQQNRILFGYQYKQAEFRDGDLDTDFSYYGPIAGFDFRF